MGFFLAIGNAHYDALGDRTTKPGNWSFNRTTPLHVDVRSDRIRCCGSNMRSHDIQHHWYTPWTYSVRTDRCVSSYFSNFSPIFLRKVSAQTQLSNPSFSARHNTLKNIKLLCGYPYLKSKFTALNPRVVPITQSWRTGLAQVLTRCSAISNKLLHAHPNVKKTYGFSYYSSNRV